MKCQEFERLVTDLAGDRLMDAMSRRRLLGHSEGCLACAQRLEQERTLTSSLAALAETTENAEASPGLKTELLGAFAQLHAPANRFVLKEDLVKTQRGRQRGRWMLAAAAALILAVLGSASLFWRFSTGQSQMVENHPTPPTREPTQIAPSPTPNATEQKTAEPREDRSRPALPPVRRLRPSTIRNLGAPTLASVSSQETTTDYIPLTYLSDATALQSGVVVRVEIPRATLLAMGLPMNSERGNSLVKADVVVSDDGVARAIRLVQ